MHTLIQFRIPSKGINVGHMLIRKKWRRKHRRGDVGRAACEQDGDTGAGIGAVQGTETADFLTVVPTSHSFAQAVMRPICF